LTPRPCFCAHGIALGCGCEYSLRRTRGAYPDLERRGRRSSCLNWDRAHSRARSTSSNPFDLPALVRSSVAYVGVSGIACAILRTRMRSLIEPHMSRSDFSSTVGAAITRNSRTPGPILVRDIVSCCA